MVLLVRLKKISFVLNLCGLSPVRLEERGKLIICRKALIIYCVKCSLINIIFSYVLCTMDGKTYNDGAATSLEDFVVLIRSCSSSFTFNLVSVLHMVNMKDHVLVLQKIENLSRKFQTFNRYISSEKGLGFIGFWCEFVCGLSYMSLMMAILTIDDIHNCHHLVIDYPNPECRLSQVNC